MGHIFNCQLRETVLFSTAFYGKIDVVKKRSRREKTGEGKEPMTLGKNVGFRSSTRQAKSVPLNLHNAYKLLEIKLTHFLKNVHFYKMIIFAR